MYRINKTTKEFYRAGFISSSFSFFIYDVLSQGPISCKDIQKAIGSNFNQEGLEAWLDLGVSLGELAKSSAGYSIKGAFSKGLLKNSNDAWKAFLQARVEIFYNYIINTPAYLKQNKQFEFSESYGELFARSSRTVEPILFDVVDRIIPKNKPCHLLEVGCGSGVYIKRACDRNPKLTATGLEMQKEVAELARKNTIKWQIDDRVIIEPIDIRKYTCEIGFDLVTFHNLIYYFPVNERIDVLQYLGDLLNPGGQLIITTICQWNDPGLKVMNLWGSMTDGCGPLPYQEQVCDQLKKAGFDNVQCERLIPSFYLFKTEKPY